MNYAHDLLYCPTYGSIVLTDEELTAGAKFLALVLEKFSSQMAVVQWPGKEDLAKLMGVGAESVDRGLKALKEAGYLSRERAASASVYRLSIPHGRRMHHFDLGVPPVDGRVVFRCNPEQAKTINDALGGDALVEKALVVFCGLDE